MAVDPSVPAGAAKLLDFIGSIEAPQGYGTIYGNNQGRLPKPLTSMTLDEVEAAQVTWTKRFGSSACGRYQFMKNTLDAPGTLRDIEGEMGLTGKEKFTPRLQDRIGFHLLKRRGYEAFVAGKLSRTAFGLRLAQEWASLPVLAPVRGAHRKLARGETYYAGDALNKVLTSPASMEELLDEVRRLDGRAGKAPVPARRTPAAPPAAPEASLSPKADTVFYVQTRLRELGYSEVGSPDGDLGDLTRAAILAFRSDNGLELLPVIDDALLIALPKASPRVLSPARTEATPREVREEVPEVKANWFGKIWAVIAGAGATIAAAFNWLAENFAEVRERARPVLEVAGDIPIWLYLLVFGGFAFWLWQQSRKGEVKGIEAYQAGERR